MSYRTIDADFCEGLATIVSNQTINTYVGSYNINNTSTVGLVGGGVVCTSGATVYLTNIDPGATVTWSVTPANLFVTSYGTGPTAFLQAKPNVKGPASITFTLSGVDLCGFPLPATLVQSLWVGLPGGGIDGPSVVYPQQNYFYTNATASHIDGGLVIRGLYMAVFFMGLTIIRV